MGLTFTELIENELFWLSVAVGVVCFLAYQHLERRYLVDHQWTSKTARFAAWILGWTCGLAIFAVLIFLYNWIGPVFGPMQGGR